MHAIFDSTAPHFLTHWPSGYTRFEPNATFIWCWKTTPTRPIPFSGCGSRASMTRNGTTTFIMRCTCWRRARWMATMRLRRCADSPSRPQPGAGLRLPGRAVRLSWPGPARRTERASAAAGLCRFPAEPRPGRQSRLRRAHRRLGRSGCGAGLCGNQSVAPHVPLLFMGEEFAAPSPFPFFCDFGDAARGGDAGPASRVRALRAICRSGDAGGDPRPEPGARLFAAQLDWGARTAPRGLARVLPRIAAAAARA